MFECLLVTLCPKISISIRGCVVVTFCHFVVQSETIKMDDKEEQENELLALEAIYEERQFIRSKEEVGGEIKIFLDVAQPFRIIFTNSKSSGTATNEGENSSELEVNFLPPIVLNFSYPPDYPSANPPNYTLSCKWLNRSQVWIFPNFSCFLRRVEIFTAGRSQQLNF